MIDVSGSMKGNRIKIAKQALLKLIQSLPVGCWFNIISFSGSWIWSKQYKFLFEN